MLELIIGNKNYSSWSLRPWLAMHHVGIPFRETNIPLYNPDSKEAILRRSPSGTVPALLDGTLLVWESLAICEYIAERFPDSRLWPADLAARAVARAVSHEMHAGFSALRTHMPMNVRARFPGRGRRPGVAEDIGRICDIWHDCRGRFGGGGDFLFGSFSIADAMYAPVVTRFVTYGVDLDQTCRRYLEAMVALPSMRDWATASAAETDRVPHYDNVP